MKNIITRLGILKFWIKYWIVRYLVYLFVIPKHKYGAEIGVREGKNARLLYKLTKPHIFYLIDDYQEKGTDLRLQENHYLNVLQWIMDTDIILLKLSSAEASKISPGFNWVYIDADHTNLYNDLTIWYPKMREKGVMIGDDYNNPDYPEVKRDLERFCDEREIKLHTLHQQWWIRV